MKKLITKASAFALSGLMAFSSMPVYAAEPSIKYTDPAITKAGTSDCVVTIDGGKSSFEVTLPKTMDGDAVKGSINWEYTAKVEGDIAGNETVSVVPDAEFALSQAGKADVPATVTQEKTVWDVNDVMNAVEETGLVEAKNISAGTWTGSFNWNISIDLLDNEQIPEAHTHNYESVITKDATCNESGIRTYTCKCGNSYTEVIEINSEAHINLSEAVVENYVKSTHMADGSYDSVIYCEDCEAEISREHITITKGQHISDTPVEENRVEPTCTTDGSYDSVVYCASDLSECGSETKVELERTTIVIPATGHVEVSANNAVAATCESTGLTAGTHCSVCNAVITSQSVVPATGHTNSNTVKENIIVATCTTKGSYENVIYCSVCNKELSRVSVATDMLAHTSVSANNAVAATCTTAGKNSDTKCSVCGKTLTTGSTIAAKGHNLVNGVCSRCGYVQAGLYDASGNLIKTLTLSEAGTDAKGVKGLLTNKVYKVILPEGVTSIGTSAFEKCTNLKSVTIPNSVVTIGAGAFMNCTSLTSVTIPSSVTSISNYAFMGCTSLTSVTIPSSVTSIGFAAFSDVPHIYYSGSASGRPWEAKAIN